MKTYFAKSILASKTLWVNVALFVIALSETQEFTNVIPATAQPYMLQFAAVANVALRIFTVRPVAMIGLNDVKPVTVDNAEGKPKAA